VGRHRVTPARSSQAGEVDELDVLRLVGVVFEVAARALTGDGRTFKAGGVDRFEDRGARMVALDVAGRHALPEAFVGLDERLEHGAGRVAGLERPGGLAMPAEEGTVDLAHEGLGEPGAKGLQRVDVEGVDAGGREQAGDAFERGDELVLAEQVVDGVVEARHEIEGSRRRQLAHVGHEQILDLPAELRASLLEHLGREVAGAHRVAAGDQRGKALARAAGDIQGAPSAEPGRAGASLDLREPGFVRKSAGEPIVMRGERRVSCSRWG
jgi:hypothetical protein